MVKISLILSLLILGNQFTLTGPDIEEIKLDRIAWEYAYCESSQTPDLKVMDRNGEYSYGMLQFQEKSFNYLGELCGLQHDDIYSYEQQRDIFKCLWKKDLVKKHWKNCHRKITANVL